MFPEYWTIFQSSKIRQRNIDKKKLSGLVSPQHPTNTQVGQLRTKPKSVGRGAKIRERRVKKLQRLRWRQRK